MVKGELTTTNMKEFNVTIVISDNEETETIDFLIEAESFEKAVDSIRNDLDI